MVDPALVLIVGIPLAWHVALAGVAYVDAPNHDLSPVRWTAISLLVPLFGFLAYLFEREERLEGPDADMFADGPFEIHESRADDAPLTSSPSSASRSSSSDASDEDGREHGRPAESSARRRLGERPDGGRRTDDERDEP